jgi:Mrp family chromosome partitioning ATPase
MLGGRSRLPVLAEIAGPGAEPTRVWSLRREDLERLRGILPRLGGSRVVLVSGGEESARLVALALASASAAADSRTLLLECDLARPLLAGELGLNASPGLREYLGGEAEPAEVLQPLSLAGPAADGAREPLVCIVAGAATERGEELLDLDRFGQMIAGLRSAYERVVIAGPPLDRPPGALAAAARQADAVLGGLPASLARGGAGRAERRALRRLPARALGTITVACAQRS